MKRPEAVEALKTQAYRSAAENYAFPVGAHAMRNVVRYIEHLEAQLDRLPPLDQQPRSSRAPLAVRPTHG